MRKTIIALVVLLLLVKADTGCQAETVETFGTGVNQFSITFVPIGNPGNPADTTGEPNPAGSVGYHYNMGKFEVSRDMVHKANAEGGLGISQDSMSFVVGGPRPNMPATGISWNEAARLVNWLNTSQGFQAAYKFDAQPGQPDYSSNANIQLWQLGEPGFDSTNPYRNSQARYFLPSAHEWYKAAYYDPKKDGGLGGYWDYPTGSDTVPTNVSGGTAAGTAVWGFWNSLGPADVENAGGLSPYGVMGLAGNVREWEETAFNLLNNNPSEVRGVRGGSWSFNALLLHASFRQFVDAVDESNHNGFRVASMSSSTPAATILASHIKYSNWSGTGSPFDEHKSLAQSGIHLGPLTLSNLINSAGGINGLVFDVQNLWNPDEVGLQDFRFQMSPQGAFDELDNPVNNWQDAPNPSEISVTEHPQHVDVSRISIRWDNGQIMNRWIRVTMESTSNTGLAESQVYYLGHLLGETTGTEDTTYTVSFADISQIRQLVGGQVDASSFADINKDGIVSFADISAMSGNIGTALRNITLL